MEANGSTSMIEPESPAAARPTPLDGAGGMATPAGDGSAAAPVARCPCAPHRGSS